MTYDVANRADKFKVGDAVKMGSGEEGVVKQFVTSPTGFHSYRVEVTSGPRKGAVVTATAPAMSRRKASRQAALVRVGNRTFTCRVARSPREHAQGLQGSDPLSLDEGLLFVFEHPRPATFHMGTVSFPIDIAFIENGRVARVVRSAQPGSKERWSYPRCDAVLETAAGCAPPVGASVRTFPHVGSIVRALDAYERGDFETAEDLDAQHMERKRRAQSQDVPVNADPALWSEFIGKYGHPTRRQPDGDVLECGHPTPDRYEAQQTYECRECRNQLYGDMREGELRVYIKTVARKPTLFVEGAFRHDLGDIASTPIKVGKVVKPHNRGYTVEALDSLAARYGLEALAAVETAPKARYIEEVTAAARRVLEQQHRKQAQAQLSEDELFVLREEAQDLLRRYSEPEVRSMMVDKVVEFWALSDPSLRDKAESIVNDIMGTARTAAQQSSHPPALERNAAGGWSPTFTLSDREYAPLDVEQHKDDAHSNAPREVHDVFFPDSDGVMDQTHDDDRFRDRSTPDVSSPNRMDNPAPGWEQQLGYDTVHYHDDPDAPAFRPSAAFHIDASKKLNKFLDRLDLTADLPEWMEQDHASKAWLLRALRDLVQTTLHARPPGGYNPEMPPNMQPPTFYSPEGPTRHPESRTPDNVLDLGVTRAAIQRILDKSLNDLRQLQPYVDHGDKLGIDWSSDNTPLDRVSTLVKDVKKSKGPREGLADFEVLSPYVTKINSAHAATLIHGAEKSTREEGDYGWCTGWFWNDYFDQYTGRDGAEIYLVRTGPATEKKVINGKEILLASPDSRDIFNVYVGSNDAEVQAPNNEGIEEEEFEEVVSKLRDAGADIAADLLEEHQEQGDVEGLGDATTTMYVITHEDMSVTEGTLHATDDHGDAERFAQDAEACDYVDVDIWEVTIPRHDADEYPERWEILESSIIQTVHRDPIELYIVVEGTDSPADGRFTLLGLDPVRSDEIEPDELRRKVMSDDALRAKAIANGMSIWGVAVHPRQVEYEDPKYWDLYYNNTNQEYEFEPVDDDSIVVFSINNAIAAVAHDGAEIGTGSETEMEALAAQLYARDPELSVYHDDTDVTAQYAQRAENLLNPTPNVGQQAFDLGEENAPFGDQPTEDDLYGTRKDQKVVVYGEEVVPPGRRVFDPSTHERLATVTVMAQDLEITDPVDLIVGLIQGMVREERPLDWHRDALNANLAYAIVEPSDVAGWIGNLGMAGSEATDVLDAATSPQGMQVLGDGLVLAGLAKIANIAREDGQHLLVLWTEYNDVAQ